LAGSRGKLKVGSSGCKRKRGGGFVQDLRSFFLKTVAKKVGGGEKKKKGEGGNRRFAEV